MGQLERELAARASSAEYFKVKAERERDEAIAALERATKERLKVCAALKLSQAEVDRLLAVLWKIRDEYGQVCETYEICEHESCRGSYSAWALADAVLQLPPEQKSEIEKWKEANKPYFF